jgi:hypothetical protein
VIGVVKVSGSVCLTVVGTDSSGDGCLTVTKIDSVVGPLGLVRRLCRMVVVIVVAGTSELSAVSEYRTVFTDFGLRWDDENGAAVETSELTVC